MATLDDRQRLRALERGGLLEHGADPTFDRLTRVVCEVLDVPVATVTFVEPQRQLFRGATGLDEPWLTTRETPLDYSFCQHCVLSAQPFVIDDATRHPLLKDSPAVDELGVVAYAGVPIIGGDGTVFGTLCAIDHVPRAWTDDDLRRLRDLAAGALSEIERRVLAAEVARRRRGPTAEASAAREPGLNIAALSKRTGVAPDTLRKWEQRYGILKPQRTSGGQRRYTELDVARVEWLQARLADGYRIGEAASLLGDAQFGDTSRTPAEHLEALFDAARATDPARVARVLDQAFALHPLAQTLTQVIQPLLRRVGDAWERGELTVAQEHLVSEAVRARIERLLADARGGVRGVAVLACAPGERHDLGLLMLAVLLRADGWQVAYLGADTPLDDALELADRLSASVVALSATMRDSAEALEEALTEATLPPGVTVVIGGPTTSAALARRLGVRRGSDDPAAAMAELRELAA